MDNFNHNKRDQYPTTVEPSKIGQSTGRGTASTSSGTS